MPAPGAGGVQTSLVGTVQSMMASARNAFRRKPGPTPGAPIKSPGGNPPALTQFSETFEPSGGLFAPGYPLPPVEPERLRALDYPVGYNYIYTPRSFEPIGFAELRALAQNHDITRLCIETRKDQIEALDWSIKPRDERNPKAGAEKRADALTEFWRCPDGNTSSSSRRSPPGASTRPPGARPRPWRKPSLRPPMRAAPSRSPRPDRRNTRRCTRNGSRRMGGSPIDDDLREVHLQRIPRVRARVVRIRCRL